ncbi:hypothetical protein KGF57_003444 [Candida theae]|uniref:FAD-binding FR-type domain-containing protein n=1 Tax=Candida theae TaxID=1198502 RepID=A0AAD5BCX0_9ASCO|nr:uncharacterized protein KGF57_003444 [Candida theae]KAI5955959.1 hypothetical protein KGF57_003444 [Candida theae]
MSELPVELQKLVEKDRNTKNQWISCAFSLIIFAVHGVIFFWIPRTLRQKRFVKSNRFKLYFVLLNIWNTLNYTLSMRIRSRKIYYKPSVLILFLFFILLNGKLCYVDTHDITYIPKTFAIAKRCARVGIGQVPAIFLLITKGDFITGVTGLTYERTTFLHIWFSFMMFVVVTFHVAVVFYYWDKPEWSSIHPKYPQNVYGIIAYATFVLLALGNVKIIRKYWYDQSMVNHRVQSFIMLLMAFFHNNSAKAMVVIGVHLLVLDKVIGRIYGIVHSKKSPTKGWSQFEMLDDDIMKVSIPVKVNHKFNPNSWFGLIKFKYGNWKAGSHIYFNVRKIDFFQHHPFMIASLPDSGKMVVIVRKRNGFTKKMFEKFIELRDKQLAGEETEMDYILWYRPKLDKLFMNLRPVLERLRLKSTSSPNATATLPEYRKIVNPETVIWKVAFRGPSGGKCQPLLTFDSVAFLAQGLGASFILPVCLDLLQTIDRKEVDKDYLGRPAHPIISVYWSVESVKMTGYYSHLLGKLIKFIKLGKLKLIVFIEGEAVNDQPIELNPFKNNGDKNDVSVRVSTEVEKCNSSNISMVHSIPTKLFQPMDIDQTLKTHIASIEYSGNNYFKSLAILSCGEDQNFGKSVEYHTQSYRWMKEAPNIYFYNESYYS